MTSSTPHPAAPAPGSGALDQLIQSQIGTSHGDATTYLRAGAHVDPAFRNAVIAELDENPHRIPAPAPGIDTVAVLHECRLARRRAVRRSALLLLAPVAALPVDVGGALLPLLLVLTVCLSVPAARKLIDALVWISKRLGVSEAARWVRAFGALVWIAALAVTLPLLAGTAVALTGLTTLDSQCGTSPYGQQYCPEPDGPGLAPLWAALITVALWTAVAVVDRHGAMATLHRLATGRAAVPPNGGGRHAARTKTLRQQQDDPDVVFSEFAPFVGAGAELDHWSFAIELIPDEVARNTGSAPHAPLTTPVVHAALRRALRQLGEPGAEADYPGDRLHTITVDDHVFKGGRRLGPAGDWSGAGPGTAFARMAPYAWREASELLVQEPDGMVPPTWWPDCLDLAAEETLRHYLAVRVSGWRGEVVLTVFFRVQLQGRLLYLENRAFVMPPVARAYHVLDEVLPPAGVRDWAALIGRSLVTSAALAGSAPGELFRWVRTQLRTGRNIVWYQRMCREDRTVDHGPRAAVRQLGAEAEFQQLFQEMDVQRYLKSIEIRTLTAVRDCLREHAYRTDEYDARQTVVINNGVQVNGNVTGNIQTGDHAQAAYQQVITPQPTIGT